LSLAISPRKEENMPGFDGTGPMGMGPMTGGGGGFCATPGVARRPRYGRLSGWGRQGGCGWRWGGPMYWGRPAIYPTMSTEELDFLKNEAEAMKEELKQIETRIEDMEKSAGQTQSPTS
jgi:hypothetical protein